VAGIGILAGLEAPNSLWASLAFAGGLITQARSIFRMPDTTAQHRGLKDEYSSFLSLFKGVVGRTKDAGALTDDPYVQLQLIFERYRVATERDDTDYETEEAARWQEKVGRMYPPDRLWVPEAARRTLIDRAENREQN